MEHKQPSTVPDEAEQYRLVFDFNAPIEKCFEAGTSEEAMMVWVPNIAAVRYDHTRADRPYGAGSFREVQLKGGLSLIERILISQPSTLLVYTIEANAFVDRHVLRNYRGRMQYAALNDKHTRLTWAGQFGCTPLLRPIIRPVIRKMIRTFATRMTGYLARA